jgi:hypothetical protein
MTEVPLPKPPSMSMLASRAELRYTERCLRSYGDARVAAALKDLGVSPSGPRSPVAGSLLSLSQRATICAMVTRQTT